MASSFDAFLDRLERAFQKRGARAAFVRASEIPQSALQRWLNREGEPSLSSVDRAAAALGYDSAWEMLRPDTPERTLAERIDELKAVATASSALPPAVAEIIPRLVRIAGDQNKMKLLVASLDGLDPPSLVEQAKERRR